jgi:alpha-beta hydrolase superfamily lysophospholipase
MTQLSSAAIAGTPFRPSACGDAAPEAPVSRSAASTARASEDCRFTAHDGTEIFYRRWPASMQPTQGAILLLHRGHEHSGRMAHLADELGLPGFDIFAWDARGHGRSAGPRGHAPDFAALVRDLQDLSDHVARAHGIAAEQTAVVAQSVGAVVAAAWAHDYAPKLRGLVLASPAFDIRLYVPFARAGLRLLRRLRGDFAVNSYVNGRLLTRDAARARSYAEDPLIARPISADLLLDLQDTADRIVADAPAITVPTQLLISGDDWVVRAAPQHRFYERLGAATKERHLLPGFRHDTLGERDRAPVIAKVRDFILARFALPLERPSLRQADRIGFTRREADRLATPLSLRSGRGLYWLLTRSGLRLAGLFSSAIRTGHRTGFDSGTMLDVIYRNEAAGLGPLGRLIDRAYLDAIGWRGIRRRKLHAEELLRAAMARLRAAGMPARVMDIAAGHGRYLLDGLADQKPDSILLRDYSDLNLAAGRRLIAARGLESVAEFRKGDAFDAADLAAVEPKPTLAVVSGLYELFADNDLVCRSLGGIAATLPAGGYLVYTNQPWHPQLELIARALTSHRQGQAWIMRRRTQAEMDELVEAAGFRKIEQRIDPWGIFTVSLAVRVRS